MLILKLLHFMKTKNDSLHRRLSARKKLTQILT